MNMFATNRAVRRKRNKFNLSHERKMSLQMSNLTPIYLEETVPGDKFKINSELFIRFAPMIAPMMHRVDAYVHYFFVPNRLVWSSWEKFITGGTDGSELPAFPVIPYQNSTAAKFNKGRLPDYFGIPPLVDGVNASDTVSALPFRGYQMIYNEYYRDQNLEDPIDYSLADGVIGTQAEMDRLTTMRQRAWEKDYFTSALPWAQRSQAEVSLPIESTWNPTYLTQARATGAPGLGGMATDGASLIEANAQPIGIENLVNPQTAESSNLTINDLRRSVRLQEWLERQARGGARLTETILSHFGVKSSDARLNRPEYLGGGKAPLVISEVLQTSQTDDTVTPQGNMSGHGIAVGNTNRASKFCEEHGYIFGLLSVRPRSAYQQGIHKTWSRRDKFDFYWPSFANLGEQEILNKELYFDMDNNTSLRNNLVFGYQSRYAEMKYGCSSVHGDFRDTLAFWHMGRQFATPPSLNADFVKCENIDRVFAVTDPTEDKLYAQIYNNVSALRPMPYFGTPTL